MKQSKQRVKSSFKKSEICFVKWVLLNARYCFLNYFSIVTPYKKEDIETLEKVQKRATKLIPVLKNLPYKDRLKACNMSTLHYRRVRGDMIETFKILSGKYDTNVVPHLKTTGIQATRGNDLRIFKTLFKMTRKFYFTNRVVDACLK